MSQALRAALLPLVLLLAQVAAAKGVIVRIEIDGASLPGTLSFTDPTIVEEFSIWSGPSSGWVQSDGSVQPDYSAAFIDYRHGAIDAPSGDLLQFEVRFYIGRSRGAEPLKPPYDVRYAVDPGQPGGYMYLPDEGTGYVRHGVEDNWFRSAAKWEDIVRPAIEVAMNGAAGSR